jgi:hypothetical protein
MNAYYYQTADSIYPIYGVTSMEEAKTHFNGLHDEIIVESSEKVYMNPLTGSVGFESDWDDLFDLLEVTYNALIEYWVEV